MHFCSSKTSNFKSFDFIHKDSCSHVSKFCTQFVSCIRILCGVCLTCSYKALVQMCSSRLNFKVPPMASIWFTPNDINMLHDKRDFAHVIKVTTQLTWIWRDYPGELKISQSPLKPEFLWLLQKVEVMEIWVWERFSATEMKGAMWQGPVSRL